MREFDHEEWMEKQKNRRGAKPTSRTPRKEQRRPAKKRGPSDEEETTIRLWVNY